MVTRAWESGEEHWERVGVAITTYQWQHSLEPHLTATDWVFQNSWQRGFGVFLTRVRNAGSEGHVSHPDPFNCTYPFNCP